MFVFLQLYEEDKIDNRYAYKKDLLKVFYISLMFSDFINLENGEISAVTP